MAAAPWYLLSAGVFLVLLGFFVTALWSGGSGRDVIDPRMSDKEIARRMKESERLPVGNLVMLLGSMLIFISIVWRIVRVFV
jgi:hypothetical protein